MAHQNTPAERQLMKFVEKLPLPDEVKTGWNQQIKNEGMTEELREEIRQKLASDPEINAATKARFEVDLGRLVRQWRLDVGAKHFAK